MGNRAYDAFWGTLLRATTRSHRLVDKVSGGRLWRRFPGGQQVVWITTLGRKSGQWRRNPLLAVCDGGDWVVTGSNAGQEQVPGWVFNVRAHPEGTIEIDGDTWGATFTEVTGEERSVLYGKLVETWSSFAMYERNAGREIPVFRITTSNPST